MSRSLRTYIRVRDYMTRFGKAFYKSGMYTCINHDGIEHAGYLAFLALLSLFPFLVFFVMIATMVGELQFGAELIDHIATLVPHDAFVALEPRIREIGAGPPQGLVTISIIGVIWTASAAVEGTRTILNRAAYVSTPPAYIWRRLLSILQFFIFTLILMFATLLLVVAPVLWNEMKSALGISEFINPYWNYMRYTFGLVLLFLGVASTYYYLPNVKQHFIRVVPGAILVVLMWLGAAELFTTYLRHVHTVSIVYGSLGGVIAALIFFYIVSLIYIFGAEFNHFYEKYLAEKPHKKAE